MNYQRIAPINAVETLSQRFADLHRPDVKALPIDDLPILIAYLDKQKRYQFNNQAYQVWFGFQGGELRDRRLADVIGKKAYRRVRPYIEACLSGQTMTFDTALSLKDGRNVHVQCTYVPDPNHCGQIEGMFAFIQDVTRERKLAQQVEHQATHDMLTGLPNRVLFQHRLRQSIDACDAAVLMFIDLDDFKSVNDTLGHPFGDRLLEAVAGRLTETVSAKETVARLGGDEFAIIKMDTTGQADIQTMAQQIIDQIEAPFIIDSHEVRISASVGIAMCEETLTETSQLMKNADLALYEAKSDGRGSSKIFVDEMRLNLAHRQKMLEELRRAIPAGQLAVHYQPQVDLRTQSIAGLEALARWRHTHWGDVPPQTFIPVAESNNLIGSLGQWVLRQACEQVKGWRQAGHACRAAVNISPFQLRDPGFVDQIEKIMAAIGIEPNWLDFEITETALIETVSRDLQILEQIAKMGISLSIDDFGTGYSSLAYVKRLPVSRIKIDRSFIHDIGVDSDNEAIINAIITLSHQLGKRVIAEGVETEAQLAYLADSGCDEIQGFYCGRPQSADDINQLLHQETEDFSLDRRSKEMGVVV